MTRNQFEKAVEPMMSRLHGAANRMVGHTMADDAVQEALMRSWGALRKRPMLPQAEFEAYVFTALRTRSGDLVTREQKQAHAEGVYVAENILPTLTEDQLALQIDMQRVLGSLPAEDRDLITAHVVHGMTTRQLAQEQGVSQMAIVRKVKVILEILRARVSDYAPDGSSSGRSGR